MMVRKIIVILITACFLLAGCSDTKQETNKKVLILGDTTFNAENEEADIDPHHDYSGWAAVRYGVGETLFRLRDDMELEPWLASSYENIDAYTWKIVLRDDVSFSDGRHMDGNAVKECFEDLVDRNDRAAKDLKIADIEADGQSITIHTSEPNPVLLNCLAEPYSSVIDMQVGDKDGIVVGTGPFVAEELVMNDHLYLKKNDHYWNGHVNIDEVNVLTVSDGDSLALALKSGEIDAAYGMPYADYPLFENDQYTFSTATTSRSFYLQMNFHSDLMQDDAVRKAIAMGIDKDSFSSILLNGCGEAANGVFPDSYAFGSDEIKSSEYDPNQAAKILEEDGWKDEDGDGIREKNGKKLQIRWLSYPSRQELPLLAESSQASLKKIGIDVQLNITPDHNSIVSDPAAWDVYAASFVTCPTGDPGYFFTTHCLENSVRNRGGYDNESLEELAVELENTFDHTKRKEITMDMQQKIIDDHAFVFVSFLRMSLIAKKKVTGLEAHACDYYELTSALDSN